MRLLLRWSDDDGDGIAEFHDVVHEHFDVIGAGDFEFHLGEDGNVGGIKGGVLQDEFDFAFA